MTEAKRRFLALLGMTKAWSSGFGLGILRRRSIWRIRPARLLEIAGRLAGDGLLRIEGEWAEATAGLMGRAERFEAAMQTAVEELEKKHAFERG